MLQKDELNLKGLHNIFSPIRTQVVLHLFSRKSTINIQEHVFQSVYRFARNSLFWFILSLLKTCIADNQMCFAFNKFRTQIPFAYSRHADVVRVFSLTFRRVLSSLSSLLECTTIVGDDCSGGIMVLCSNWNINTNLLCLNNLWYANI